MMHQVHKMVAKVLSRLHQFGSTTVAGEENSVLQQEFIFFGRRGTKEFSVNSLEIATHSHTIMQTIQERLVSLTSKNSVRNQLSELAIIRHNKNKNKNKIVTYPLWKLPQWWPTLQLTFPKQHNSTPPSTL
ncbi:unnamed protein product [Ilex paraguariensis]|uniref:Uncharacterized protein n=1 Tax=Ilex paraguariensis TaxID=185542 RepID=A0ABC8UEN3_9AQUA